MAKQWFILKDGRQHGPITPAELKRRAASGNLRPEDCVRPDDRQNWYKASTVKGLFASKAGESLPPPAPKVPTGTPDSGIEELVMQVIPASQPKPCVQSVPPQEWETYATSISHTGEDDDAAAGSEMTRAQPTDVMTKRDGLFIGIGVGFFLVFFLFVYAVGTMHGPQPTSTTPVQSPEPTFGGATQSQWEHMSRNEKRAAFQREANWIDNERH